MRAASSTSLFLSRVFAPAPVRQFDVRPALFRWRTRTCAAPRLRQSLAALGFGYGLNEKQKKMVWKFGYARQPTPHPAPRRASGTCHPEATLPPSAVVTNVSDLAWWAKNLPGASEVSGRAPSVSENLSADRLGLLSRKLTIPLPHPEMFALGPAL